MEAIEIVAANVKEATDKAAAEFGVDANQVQVTVLEETKGLFGKGQVRIKAEVKAKAEKPAKSAVVKEAPPKAEKKARPAPKKAAPKKEEATATAVVETTDSEEQESGAEVVASQEDAEGIVALLTDLLAESGLNITMKISEVKGKYINLSLGGRDVSYLVGRRGEVLNALQYLMNIIVSRQLDNGVRVVIDGDNYRRRREEVLEKLALDIAAEVQKRGEEAVLDALPAFERRVIHQALSDFEGVVTYSEGEEPDRRVVIAPAEVA